jgi:hypothetical protein
VSPRHYPRPKSPAARVPWSAQSITSILAAGAIVAVSAGIGWGFASVVASAPTISAAAAPRSEVWAEPPDGLALAQALTAALNGHEVETLVALFTAEDAGPSVSADRYAWQKFEIALWAHEQVRANIRVEAYDYRLTQHGVEWDADVYRDDWAALGVRGLQVTNSVWVHQGKVANFSAIPRDPRDAERLGNLWRSGSTPARPTN